ncbi:PAS domain S-box-containing protein/diguanylate cyclase (GGDEF) domain-containing protein [Humidesulfovibrio mexicanus]|uniref:PAS domain S-box-containing protein/diguanylate cyclase (GGDEF) domain-containing protein n=1 Tax=Humidesulfovibrio mexicanus TaxID=147047 RepID=A0A238Z5R1_9BACT|nr:EAL domain-containing protein [Humidesulfovibrio mexicanus]SNR78261.1 PAS domain S-box-containing protein/diguanylate cyclase (GGDEF) domain-containing protein [Humidesulfovibrio mexicanus]
MSSKPFPLAASPSPHTAPSSGKTPRRGLPLRALSSILDSLSLPVFATDRKGRLAFVNRAACTVLGKPAEALLGASEALFFPPPTGVERHASERVLTWNGREHVVCVLREAMDGGGLTAGHVLDLTPLRDTELACALHQKRLEALVMGLSMLLMAFDEHGRVAFWNRECERALGYTADEALGAADIMERLYPDPERRQRMRAWHTGEEGPDCCEAVMRARDGGDRTIVWNRNRHAQPVTGWVGWASGVDVTDRAAAQNALREAERRADALFRQSPLGMHVYRLTPSGRLLLVAANPAADKILHRDHGPLLGQPLEAAFPELSGAEPRRRIERACSHGELWRTERNTYRDEQAAGAYEVHCFQIEPRVCALMFLDHTEQKRLETRLRHQALHDPLTGIANRSLCVERIDTALQRVRRRPDYRYAVILIDLDRFKLVNESLGHTAGDALLIETAARLRACVRELDTVARTGGDEFVVVMEEFDSYKRPIQAIRRIRHALAAPVTARGQELSVTASIGLALGQTPADSAEEVLRNATLAMHRAKSMGKNRVKSFTPSLLAQTLKVVRLENEMDRAIARGEFFLEFQPIVQMGKQQGLFGFEALARWRHPERGLVMPGEFIPIAEESGKVVELGYWALREGSRILNSWRRRHPHLRDAVLSVNLSPQQVPRPDFLPRVRDILAETGLPTKNLKLEVTETALMQSGTTVLNKLAELREMGVTFSVDDFGTGYSSLAYLTRLPLDHLKIDLSFVHMLEHGKENLEIVKAIIQLATSLRMDVVAEGVETRRQQSILLDLGCEFFQGYLFAKPLPEAQAEAFLGRFEDGVCPFP